MGDSGFFPVDDAASMFHSPERPVPSSDAPFSLTSSFDVPFGPLSWFDDIPPPDASVNVMTQELSDAGHRRAASSPVRIHHLNGVFTHAHHSRQLIPSSYSTPAVDTEFADACANPSLKLNPRKLGLVPSKIWGDHELTFGEIVTDFFQKKNNSTSRFLHKLFNALKISEAHPFCVPYMGIEWVTDRVVKVDKLRFARLLGIKTIDGSLFHQQGNFPSHGFVELSEGEAREMIPLEGLQHVDYDAVRLLTHQPGVFTRGCQEGAIGACKWSSTRARNGR
jgi:hypothetical protein